MLYALANVADGCAITDAVSGKVVRVDDEPQVGLSLDEAMDVVELLSRIELRKPKLLN